jgi:hypothetical protein
LLVCLDGWRGWVLMAARIDTESPLQMGPVVEKTVSLFGEPVATVRDLGEGGRCAVEPLRKRGIPDLICHYHFLAAVGSKLFDLPYGCLRSTLRTTRVRADLRARPQGSSRTGAHSASCATCCGSPTPTCPPDAGTRTTAC